MSEDSASADVKNRARDLFLYLRELAALRARTVRDVADYEQVVWLADLPDGGHSTTAFDSEEEDDLEFWLEVDRVELPDVPPPPPDLLTWLDVSQLARYDVAEPTLTETEDEPISDDTYELYLEYIERSWNPWAARARELAPSYEFYTDMFAMSERRQRLGEVFEIVVGLGLVAWRRDGQVIRRHLITTPAEIEIDANTGRITVAPTTAEGRNRFEIDMLESTDQGGPDVVRETRDEVERTDPLALIRSCDQLLTRWVNRAHHSGRMTNALHPIEPELDLRVATAPAVILRRRGQRTTSELLDSIAQELGEEDAVLPEGILRLVTATDTQSEESKASGFTDPEVYFPLPSNREQRQIVERMQHQRGVLVQGPPGTGKSLTIANLIAHLLAQGKRVLVTSHTERALRVLQEKLPPEIKPLCVSLLGSDRESTGDLEAAVAKISGRRSSWSANEADESVALLRSRLESVRSETAAARSHLRQISEDSAQGITVGEYTGTTLQIAKQLQTEHDNRGWIPDEVSTTEPPLSDDEFDSLLDLAETLTESAATAAAASLPNRDEIVAPRRFDSLVALESQATADLVQSRDRIGGAILDVERLPTEELAAADAALSDYLVDSRSVTSVGGWTATAASDVLGGHGSAWAARHDAGTPNLDRALALVGDVGHLSITGLGDHSIGEALAATGDLLEYTTAGGPLRTGFLASRIVKDNKWVLEDLRLDGAAPTTPDRLEQLHLRLELEQCSENLSDLWSPMLDRSDEPIALRIARCEDTSVDLERVLRLGDHRSRIEAALSTVPSLLPADWTDTNSIVQLADAVAAVKRYRQVEDVSSAIRDAREAFGDDPHPTLAAARSALDARDTDGYRRSVAVLLDLIGEAEAYGQFEELSDRLRSVAPILDGQITATEPVVPSGTHSFTDAWAWREATTYLGTLLRPGASQRLSQSVARLEEQEMELIGELSATLAWRRMFETLGADQATALAAWAVAIRRVGRGTGKYAERHRRTAREYMRQATDAIPAWIMPTFRVAENMQAMPDAFDVVIVDEASQSSVESLFLFYLGRQVVVVGDDQQIAPEAVGIDLSVVHRLQEQYLKRIPFMELLNPNSSLFDQANVHFPGRIVLREHFRCMPEIIQFSNKIAYRQQSLVPLRDYGSDRLAPIRTVYLSHGYREGGRSALNRPEAEEIVTRIEKICADPEYDSKSIGVISLQGDHQATLIERMLLERVGPKEMLARRIVCGDAYAFQGDERDIIFLSMVAAPNERIGVLSRETDMRRFNVAASRAKDQVWLVHSVRPEDLSASGLRRRMLEYYLDPKVEQLDMLGEFDPAELHPAFDSQFEQDVYLRIADRGFRVIPQYPVAGFRIDLVVEGMRGRLAVECDGDRWHGPDRWEADSSRQRQLERCGWKFFRIAGSAFYSDPDGALDALWRRLERLGIHPSARQATTGNSTRVDPITGSSGLRTPDSEALSADLLDSSDTPSPREDGQPADIVARPEYKSANADASGPAGQPSQVAEPHPLRLRIGSHLRHPWKGAAEVVGLWDPPASDDSVVEIRFETGDQFTYSLDEYQQAGFVPLDLDRDRDAMPPNGRTADSAGQGPEPGDRTNVDEAASRTDPGNRASAQVAPYVNWSAGSTQDPRTVDRVLLAGTMKSVVEAEGPVTADRIYRLVVRSAGFTRVTHKVRHPLNRALFAIPGVSIREFDNPLTNWPQRVVRISDTPEYDVRELGPRDLYEVPLDEIAALMARLDLGDLTVDQEGLKRRVLAIYGLRRLTAKVDEYLEAAIDLLHS